MTADARRYRTHSRKELILRRPTHAFNIEIQTKHTPLSQCPKLGGLVPDKFPAGGPTHWHCRCSDSGPLHNNFPTPPDPGRSIVNHRPSTKTRRLSCLYTMVLLAPITVGLERMESLILMISKSDECAQLRSSGYGCVCQDKQPE